MQTSNAAGSRWDESTTQVGFDHYGNQQGSGAQLTSILARLTRQSQKTLDSPRNPRTTFEICRGAACAVRQSAAEVLGAGQDIETV
jgi:hypothetical protein